MLERNRTLLARRFPRLLELLERCPASDESQDHQIISTPVGDPSLRLGASLVHSAHQPRREAQRLVQAALSSERDGPVVLLGLGLGYTALAASELCPAKPLIIAEADPSLMLLALSAVDLSPVLSHPDLAIICGGAGEDVLAALEQYPGQPSIVQLRAVRERYPTWYASAERSMSAVLSRDGINQATLRKFGKRWLRNQCRNLSILAQLPGVRFLEGLYKEIPAFVAAAGPSLDKILPLLPALADRCVIIAVDTAVRALLSAGIEPDFIVVADPQFWNARHLDHCFSPSSVLVTTAECYPPVLRLQVARRFLFDSAIPPASLLAPLVDPKGQLAAGGSVATTAWDLARLLGCRLIILAGLDLAFPNRKTHFRGARFESLSHARSNRIEPAEQGSFRGLRDGKAFMAPAMSGGSVLTDQRLSLYAAWFENRFQQYPETSNRALTQDGLAIAGLRGMDDAELLALPPRRKEINERLTDGFNASVKEFLSPQALREREVKLQEAVAFLIHGLQTMENAGRGNNQQTGSTPAQDLVRFYRASHGESADSADCAQAIRTELQRAFTLFKTR